MRAISVGKYTARARLGDHQGYSAGPTGPPLGRHLGTTDDGLGANVVYLLYQDRAGHIWAGTSNGVSRYDGEKWINFTTASHGCWFPPCFPAYNEIERGDMRALERALQTRENEAKTPPARSTWSYR